MTSVLHLAAALSRREHALLFALENGRKAMNDLPDKMSAIAAAVGLFERHQLPHTLIGGLAVGVRSGIPRATRDVNFAIPSTAEREQLRTWFEAEGFASTGTFAHSMNFRHESGEPVQLAFDPEFDAMIGRAPMMSFGAMELRVVTTADLIAMKRRAAADPGRRRSKALRDQADIALLEGDVPEPDEGW